MDWKDYFDFVILERGLDYFRQGLVRIRSERDGVISATVQGYDLYDVRIKITEDGKKPRYNLFCSCPHADDGNHCKHMAATLFQYEHEHLPAKPSLPKDSAERPLESIDQVVYDADPSFVKAFLLEVLQDDPLLEERFRVLSSPLDYEVNIDAYQYKVDDMIDRYADHYGSIGYAKAWNFTCELDAFISESTGFLIDNDRFSEAFDLMNYIFQAYADLNIDDSDGSSSSILERASEVWDTLINRGDLYFKREAYEWFALQLDEPFESDLKRSLEDVLFRHFSEREFLEKNYRLVLKKLSEAKQLGAGWNRSWTMNAWSMRAIEMMKKLGMESDVKAFCMENLDLHDVFEYHMNALIEEGDLTEAIRLLEIVSENAQIAGHRRHSYKTRLLDLYLEVNNREEYLNLLWELALSSSLNLDLYRRLKKEYSESDWKKLRGNILKFQEKGSFFTDLLAEEELVSQLLEKVVDAHGLYLLSKYESILKPYYPGELLEKYVKEVEIMAIPTSGRSGYQSIAVELEKMKKYPDGESVVADIVARWRVKYKNRRAMMDEIGDF